MMVHRDAKRDPRLLLIGAAVVAVAFPAYLLLPRLAAEALYQVVAWGSIGVFVAGVVRFRAPLVPFLALALGWACFAAGDLLFAFYDVILDASPFPSPADGLYLAGYPLLAAGLASLTRRRQPGGDRIALIDAGIVTVAATVIGWIYLIQPYAADSSLSGFEKFFSIAYPAGDLLCLAVLARLIIGWGRVRAVPPALMALTSAFAIMLLADIAFSTGFLSDFYTSGGFIDGAYLIPYVAIGVAGLHPSLGELARPGPRSDASLSRLGLAALAATAVLTPGVMAVQTARGQTLAVPVIVGGATMAFLLVVARMATIVDALEASRDQLAHDASHDSLTGLANRGLLVRSLVSTMSTGDPVALVLADLDHFKAINDTFGHPIGDQTLVEASRRLRAASRGGLTARVGGDEFAVLLAGADAVNASEIARGIAAGVNDNDGADPTVPLLSASVGLARWAGWLDVARSDDPFEMVETLLERADVAMYEAKREGRGRLVVLDTNDLVDRRRPQRTSRRPSEPALAR
jgi:diguanylate cyclase (GGDEF)-like protein